MAFVWYYVYLFRWVSKACKKPLNLFYFFAGGNASGGSQNPTPPHGCSRSRSTQTASRTCRLILKDRCWVPGNATMGRWTPAYRFYRCYKLFKPWLGWLMLVDVGWFDYGNRMYCWKISVKLALVSKPRRTWSLRIYSERCWCRSLAISGHFTWPVVSIAVW